jgi:3-oxoacyl-[acyl-carrier protein] reductase
MTEPRQPHVLPLAGQVAVVTGGTRGLGLGIAQALAASGALVVAASRTANPRQEPTENVHWSRVNVSDPDSVQGLIDRTADAYGGPHIVVANAGISRNGRLHKISPADWLETVATNLNGTWFTVQAAAVAMRKLRRGHIVTISSCMAAHPAPGNLAYATTKSAISTLTNGAALELGDYGIRVNCVAPGILDDGMGAEVTADADLWEPYRKHLVMGRPGRVDEVGRFVANLVGPDSGYVNGATIPVDGGLTMWK